MHVANGPVTANTRHRPGARVRIDLLNDRLVTVATASLGDLSVALLDLDWFVKIPQSKGERMMIAVARLGKVLAHEIGRGMAIVAASNRVMA